MAFLNRLRSPSLGITAKEQLSPGILNVLLGAMRVMVLEAISSDREARGI
jgi:hypothetical protein